MREKLSIFANGINYKVIDETIKREVYAYLCKNNIKAVINGISGGLDSAVTSKIMSTVCKQLRIPFIGRFLHIETNKEEERLNAERIGKCYCTDYKEVDLTEVYKLQSAVFTDLEKDSLVTCEETERETKIRLGNIKARIRMSYLYNLAQRNKGLVCDNDNMTEHLLGFWTIGGDIGDLAPIYSLLKTEVYDLARYYLEIAETEEEKEALRGVINITPTDGLGITSSDVEQFGCKSYAEADEVLLRILTKQSKVDIDVDGNVVTKIYARHINSEFKRNHPHRIIID